MTDADPAADSCDLPPPAAAFVFTITNAGTRDLRLSYGCGGTLPITLNTASGQLGISPGQAAGCEKSCEDVYAGVVTFDCTCGQGYRADIGPGESTTIDWDRRVYREHSAQPACSGSDVAIDCALPILPDGATSANITYHCISESGDCSQPESVPFAVDLSSDGLTIELQ